MNAPIFFFTAEDPREIPKGSRDPLRMLPVWAEVGRRMVPYLTTVTPSYRGFLTRFLFHGAVEDFCPALAHASREAQWEAFCRFEQLCAIVRSHTVLSVQTPNFPGISGIPDRIRTQNITVGFTTDYWLVRSQKNTGFWGYYHQASLGSSILKENSATPNGYLLSDGAKAIFEGSYARDLLHRLEKPLTAVLTKKTVELEIWAFEELATFFAEKPYRQGPWGDFWFEHILLGGQKSAGYSEATKRAFSEEVEEAYRPELSSGQIWELLTASPSEDVREHAIAVRSSEAVIGLCEWVFDVCRVRHESGESLDKAASSAAEYGYSQEWLYRLGQIPPPGNEQLARFREIALKSENSFKPLATELLARHKSVMVSRRGAAWVEHLDDGRLDVREPGVEPWPRDFGEHFKDYPSGVRWRYDYFMNAWTSAAREIGFIPEAADE